MISSGVLGFSSTTCSWLAFPDCWALAAFLPTDLICSEVSFNLPSRSLLSEPTCLSAFSRISLNLLLLK